MLRLQKPVPCVPLIEPAACAAPIMEMGLIHPPVGLNIFVIKNIAPDIPLGAIIWGVLPFVVLMFVAVVVICVLPQIATALPDAVMGAVPGR